jgi:hypothetical protein
MVDKVSGLASAPMRVEAFIEAQEPNAAAIPINTIPIKPGKNTPFSIFGKWSPESPMKTFTNPPAAPQTTMIQTIQRCISEFILESPLAMGGKST